MEKFERPKDTPHERESSPVNEEGLLQRIVALDKENRGGGLGDEAFRELLDCEMTLYAYREPGIEGVFDPQTELAEIRKLPAEFQRPQLDTFKKELFAQRHAYMECRRMIERAIEHNPDTDAEDLERIASFFGKHYGFPKQSRDTISHLIGEYTVAHKKTEAMYRSFDSKAALVNELTGIWPPLPAQVRVDPMSIGITTDRETARMMYAKTLTGSRKESENLPEFLGFQSSKSGILYTVEIGGDWRIETTRIHEREHATNKVMKQHFSTVSEGFKTNLERQIALESDTKKRARLIDVRLTLSRDEALEDAKDELFAMFKDRESDYFASLISKEGGPYDYLKEERDAYAHNPEWSEAVKKILIEEYDRTILKAVAAFTDLKLRGDYTNDEAIALLTDVPLEKWPNMVRHLWGNRNA